MLYSEKSMLVQHNQPSWWMHMIPDSTQTHHSTPRLSIVSQLKSPLQQGQGRAFVNCQSHHKL